MIEKNNYDKLMQKILQGFKSKKSLLLHSCCGICTAGGLERLLPYFDITLFYYNPNIDTKQEFDKRLDVVNKLADTYSLDVIVVDYDNYQFDNVVIGLESEPERGKRCDKCIKLRLEKTYQIAKQKQFDYFTTSLTLSPLKNSDYINSIGVSMTGLTLKEVLVSLNNKKTSLTNINNNVSNLKEVCTNVSSTNDFQILTPQFLLSDFKKNEGVKNANQLANKLNLYRQNYCGCKYSKSHIEY